MASTEWTADLKASRPAGDPGHAPIELVKKIVDVLTDGGAAAASSRDESAYAATFSVNAETAWDGARIAAEMFRRAAREIGLPDWPITRFELMTYDELEEDLARSTFPELVGVSEIAKILGVSRQRVSALQSREGFPEPIVRLRSGPVWTRPSLNFFVDDWDRTAGRPKKAEAGV